MRTKEQQKNALPFLARGALGGVIAGFGLLLWSVISNPAILGYAPYLAAFIFQGIPLALGLGALVGGLIGASVWIVSLISGRKFGIVGRAIIGFVTALTIMTLYACIHTEEPGYYHPILSWTRQAVNWMIGALVLGVLPGIMARQKSAVTKLPSPQAP